MTTIGSTTSCSSKRAMAPGSASSTLVSRTYVRRAAERRRGVGVDAARLGLTGPPNEGGAGGAVRLCRRYGANGWVHARDTRHDRVKTRERPDPAHILRR